MKRLGFCAVIIFFAAGVVFSQGWNRGGGTQPVTVEGTLQLQNGQIALTNGNNTYFVPMLERYIGFIDGIKEGNRISIEGFVYGNILQPAKMTVNGKSYDLLANNLNGYNSGYGCCNGYSYGPMAGGFGMGRGMRGWW